MVAIRNWAWLFPLTLVAAHAYPASGPPPAEHARLYASESGRTGFKVIPLGPKVGVREHLGVLFAVEPDGTDRLLWRSPLVAQPYAAYLHDLHDHRRVVALRYTLFPPTTPSEHVLVVYGDQGQPIADYRLDQLLPAEEIRKHVNVTDVFGKGWLRNATCRFVTSGPPNALRYLFRVKQPWGREVTVDVTSGKLVPE